MAYTAETGAKHLLPEHNSYAERHAAAEQLANNGTDFETFFAKAPKLSPNRKLITGLICGGREYVSSLMNWQGENSREDSKAINPSNI